MNRRHRQIQNELREARRALQRAAAIAGQIGGDYDYVVAQGVAECQGRVEAVLEWVDGELRRKAKNSLVSRP